MHEWKGEIQLSCGFRTIFLSVFHYAAVSVHWGVPRCLVMRLVLSYSVGIGGGLQIGFGFTRDPCLCCGSCACAYIAQLSPSSAILERIGLRGFMIS
ncbi:hypothetical protein BO83DRAFT_187808 [Aspergillus eucalypticola CBS 122712]|uniref:Uncharacterized protein n=1 Tax=Aspergillus eucalypticola (strain CBS 122712 / IBT 29274) TaxID=1448314 RepID=A0A317UM03_ASPEC|nr:uncharacterized protein BO83DRAFT_187808 [Aspergillus eucalypticola CBS 122712]PWY62515.1 hypothetical protein BO83DRAFT_187808 [Aspergillus eucalypticola CBS 122712]